jgi:hypothetical protein
MVLAHAIYFKRPLMGRHFGLPFVANRISWLLADKHIASRSMLQTSVIGILPVRTYLIDLE